MADPIFYYIAVFIGRLFNTLRNTIYLFSGEIRYQVFFFNDMSHRFTDCLLLISLALIVINNAL